MVDVRPSSTLIQSSCSSPDVCLLSPCSEVVPAWKDCLSAQCRNKWRCGADVQNQSCICFYNVTHYNCDICSSPGESHDRCFEGRANMPLWPIAVVLPPISILVITGMIVVLYRVGWQKVNYQSDSLPQKTQPGTDDLAFCFNNTKLRDGAPAEKEQHSPVSAGPQQSHMSELYCGATLSNAQLVPNTELEYCEIGSISSAFHSDDASLNVSWNKHYFSPKCIKGDLKQKEDLKTLLSRFKKKRRTKIHDKPQNVASLHTQWLTNMDAEPSQHSQPCYMKMFVQPELLEPVQCLTFEEISKLNSPLKQTLSNRPSFISGSMKSTTMVHVSSGSATDSTCTCSESEYRDFSMISRHEHDRSSLRAWSFTQQDGLPVNVLFKHSCPSAAGQHKADSNTSSMFAQGERVLNMHLPFSRYVPVFEEIACLPTETSYEMQSDKDVI